MSSFSARSGIILSVGVLAIVVLVLVVNRSGNSSGNKQGFSRDVSKNVHGQIYPSSYGIRGASIDIGAYPPSVDPTYWNQFAMTWPYDPKNGIDEKTAKELLAAWSKFISKLSPDTQNAIYALFPGLQGLKSIEYYGLTNEMIYCLLKLAPYLNQPEKFKSTDDVYRLLSPEAIRLFDEQINEKPQTGLYEKPQELGWGIDVL